MTAKPATVDDPSIGRTLSPLWIGVNSILSDCRTQEMSPLRASAAVNYLRRRTELELAKSGSEFSEGEHCCPLEVRTGAARSEIASLLLHQPFQYLIDVAMR